MAAGRMDGWMDGRRFESIFSQFVAALLDPTCLERTTRLSQPSARTRVLKQLMIRQISSDDCMNLDRQRLERHLTATGDGECGW